MYTNNMDENRQTEINPLKETAEDQLHREMNNNFHVLFQIEKRLEDISNKLESNIANVDLLEEAVATFADIPTRPIKFMYSHRENKLWIGRRLSIKFDGRESEILSLMFYKNTGKPKNVKFQCSEVAEKLTNSIDEKTVTAKAVHMAVKRIESKLNNRLSAKNLLVVTTKEFYFSKITD